MPQISIIIPTYNTSRLIRRALDSVFEQSMDFDIMVVDDCSTDDTVPIVEKIKDNRITIHKHDCNRGPATARNCGLSVATGKYCAFLDGDDYWESDFLKETVSFLEAHPEAVAVSVMQCHKIIGKDPIIVPSGTEVTAPILLDDFFDFWNKYNHVCTGSVLFRTEVAQRIGGQREDLRICEDLEFWAMLALQGKWGFIPKVLFTSDGGAVTRSQGWLEKNVIRWNNAPSYLEWRKRIDSQSPKFKSANMEHALGRIARNLCYCHVMAGKESLARSEVLEHGMFFPQNIVNSVFRVLASTRMTWKLWCAILKYREYHRMV